MLQTGPSSKVALLGSCNLRQRSLEQFEETGWVWKCLIFLNISLDVYIDIYDDYAASVGMLKVLLYQALGKGHSRTNQQHIRTIQLDPTWSNLIQLDPTCPSGIACSGDRPDLLCYTLAGAWPVFCREILADYGRCVDSVSKYSIDQIKSDEISIEIQLQSQAWQVLHFQISLSSNTSENRGTTRFWFFFVLDHVHHPVRLLQEADKVEDPARSDSWKYLEMLRISVSMCVCVSNLDPQQFCSCHFAFICPLVSLLEIMQIMLCRGCLSLQSWLAYMITSDSTSWVRWVPDILDIFDRALQFLPLQRFSCCFSCCFSVSSAHDRTQNWEWTSF